MSKTFDYFLGTTTGSGFAGFFTQLDDPAAPVRTRIIKSGPGCGKSSLMRRIAERFVNAGYPVEFIHCSSDPGSLDGVLCRPLDFAIVDGTAPHVLEPSIPAAKQDVVSLYDTIDRAALTCNLERLSGLFAQNRALHERAARFAGAAASLFCEAERVAAGSLLREKLERFAAHAAARLLPAHGCGSGRADLRLAASVTPLGFVDYTSANLENYDRVVVLEDRYYAAAHRFLEVFLARALACGYDAVVCRSPLSPFDKIDCVAVPELSLCAAASGFLGKTDIRGAAHIRARRFYDAETGARSRNRLAFSRKAVLSLLGQCAQLLADAKSVHDDIEEIYRVNIDFAAVRAREAEILSSVGFD